jgi:intracellular septation protein A
MLRHGGIVASGATKAVPFLIRANTNEPTRMSEHKLFQDKLLKKIIPDLAPFLGYVVADLIWGKDLSFFVGAVLGALGFVYRLSKERKRDWFLLGDTVILAILGGFALYFPSMLFLRLKPAIIEAVFACGLSVPALVSAKTLTRWVTSFLDGYPLDDKTMASLRKSLKTLTTVLWVHLALSVWAALAATEAQWRFVS